MVGRRDENGTLYYYLEFTVKSPTLFRHNVSVYAARCAPLSTIHHLIAAGFEFLVVTLWAVLNRA